jgi:hypothetical protein
MHHTEAAGFTKGVQIGVHTLEHCAEDEIEFKDIDRFVEQGMALIPTLKAPGDFLEIESVRDWLVRHGRKDFLPEPYRQSLLRVYRSTSFAGISSLGGQKPFQNAVTLKFI